MNLEKDFIKAMALGVNRIRESPWKLMNLQTSGSHLQKLQFRCGWLHHFHFNRHQGNSEAGSKLKEQNWGYRETEVARIPRAQYQNGEIALETYRRFSSKSQLRSHQHMPVRKPLQVGERINKAVGAISRDYTRPGIVHIPTSQNGEFS